MAKTKYVNTFGIKKGGVCVKNKSDDKDITLLTPEGKRAKFQAEIKQGTHFTNDGKVKNYEKTNRATGEVTNVPRRLSDVQRAYRQGYLQAQNEQRAIYAKTHNPKK